MDFASIEKMLVAGKNQYKAFANAEEIIKVLAGKHNYANELEARLKELAEKINNSEVQISALKEEAQKINDDNIEKILAAEKKSSKILEQSQINAKELYNNVENEVLEARNKLDALKKEALAIQEQITEDNKILKKLQNAKESAKKALGV